MCSYNTTGLCVLVPGSQELVSLFSFMLYVCFSEGQETSHFRNKSKSVQFERNQNKCLLCCENFWLVNTWYSTQLIMKFSQTLSSIFLTLSYFSCWNDWARCLCARMCVLVCMFVFLCACVCVFVFLYVFLCVCVCVYVFVCVCVCLSVCLSVCLLTL